MRLCILCHVNKAEIPDRFVLGRPIKKVCKECHVQRLKQDLKKIIDETKKGE